MPWVVTHLSCEPAQEFEAGSDILAKKGQKTKTKQTNKQKETRKQTRHAGVRKSSLTWEPLSPLPPFSRIWAAETVLWGGSTVASGPAVKELAPGQGAGDGPSSSTINWWAAFVLTHWAQTLSTIQDNEHASVTHVWSMRLWEELALHNFFTYTDSNWVIKYI